MYLMMDSQISITLDVCLINVKITSNVNSKQTKIKCLQDIAKITFSSTLNMV